MFKLFAFAVSIIKYNLAVAVAPLGELQNNRFFRPITERKRQLILTISEKSQLLLTLITHRKNYYVSKINQTLHIKRGVSICIKHFLVHGGADLIMIA